MNFVIYIITVGLLWIFYAYIEGKREAHYYHFRKGNDGDLHGWFTVQRGILLAALLTPIFFIDWFTGLMVFVALPLQFPEFHDGMYYHTRNKLNRNVYIKGWCSNHNTSTAKISIKGHLSRVILASLSVIPYGIAIERIMR